MFDLTGPRRTFCDGLSRRDFLSVGALGGALTLADVLRARAATPAGRTAAATSSGRPKSAIMVYLPGGPSHIDSFDPKPEAPVEFRGEFKAIGTAVPGVRLSEHLPLIAADFRKYAVLRSLVSVNEHSDSLVMTGHSDRDNATEGHPSFGSVVSKMRSGSESAVPHFVSLRGMTRGTEPGILGIAHRPFTPSGPAQSDLRLANGVTAGRFEQRKNLLGAFDDVRRDIDATGSMAGLDAFNQKAFEMVTSGRVREALDVSREDAKTRERYKGLEAFLNARRLVEAGVGVVTLSIGGWDTHGNNFVTLRRQLPQLDRGVSMMVNDLAERGLLDDTIVIVWGEFGRTPKVNMTAGRDHWPSAMSALVAGGGLKVGQAVGATNSRGERPDSRPITVPQVLSTLYRAVGVDPALTFPNGGGRPVYVLDDREPVRELL